MPEETNTQPVEKLVPIVTENNHNYNPAPIVQMTEPEYVTLPVADYRALRNAAQPPAPRVPVTNAERMGATAQGAAGMLVFSVCAAGLAWLGSKIYVQLKQVQNQVDADQHQRRYNRD